MIARDDDFTVEPGHGRAGDTWRNPTRWRVGGGTAWAVVVAAMLLAMAYGPAVAIWWKVISR